MEYLNIVSRTVLFYFILIILMRIMGKREIGELSVFDVIVFFVISELLSISINDVDKSIFHSLVPIFALVVLQVATSFLCLKSSRIRDFIEGKPDLIIINGVIQIETMKKQRYNLDDLQSQLHEQHIDSPMQVKFAILEPSGKLSIFTKDKCDLAWPFPIIKNGVIDKQVIEAINYQKSNLVNKLDELKLNLKDVLFCYIRDDGLIFQTFEGKVYF